MQEKAIVCDSTKWFQLHQGVVKFGQPIQGKHSKQRRKGTGKNDHFKDDWNVRWKTPLRLTADQKGITLADQRQFNGVSGVHPPLHHARSKSARQSCSQDKPRQNSSLNPQCLVNPVDWERRISVSVGATRFTYLG